MTIRILLLLMLFSASILAQTPPIEPGVSQELAKWRAAHYSDVRYKLSLTLEKMSPVLKGTTEIRVKVTGPSPARRVGQMPLEGVPIILDWRSIAGHEKDSVISNVTLSNDLVKNQRLLPDDQMPVDHLGGGVLPFQIKADHLIFTYGIVAGENVIKLDFTSPILPSGSAITRYVDKEDGSEYLYSLFVPSDASTAFPVLDQPDLKGEFDLTVKAPAEWVVISNTAASDIQNLTDPHSEDGRKNLSERRFNKTKPISTYVFAFAAGPWERVSEPGAIATGLLAPGNPVAIAPGSDKTPPTSVYVRKSQAAKFKPHAAEVFRLNREGIKYFEQYFDYKFPFPKYDLVLIPEFPFGGMEHAGATFLRESSIIFPQEPTKNDHISRATLIFHEAAHQWFGDTVTMRWFDDLWLKEGFATFTAYKAMERIMPEMNAWKVFYERVKQGAYATDSTKGTTAIYQPIANLSAAKSAYGNIVYNKAPAFLRQAEFYLGEDKFQAAVRAFLKKHEFGNAGWEDLVREFEAAGKTDLKEWAKFWVGTKGLFKITSRGGFIPIDSAGTHKFLVSTQYKHTFDASSERVFQPMKFNILFEDASGNRRTNDVRLHPFLSDNWPADVPGFDVSQVLIFPNAGDYGYGIFLLDEKSRDYVLKNIQNEKDPFLRSMMWGALWDSVREGELDPREYVDLVVQVLMQKPAREQGLNAQGSSQALIPTPLAEAAAGTPDAQASATEDESTTALLLNRVGTAMNYYIEDSVSSPRVSKGAVATRAPSLTVGLLTRVEDMLIAGMQNAPTQGQRITYYRALLNIASSERARGVLKGMLKSEPPASAGGQSGNQANWPAANAAGSDRAIPLKTKDKFDIVTRLLILNDPDAPNLLAKLEKTETSDDAKRYAYAAKAGVGTAENKAKYWNDFVNKEISESWIEAAFGPWNSIRQSDLTLPYLQKALKELPNHKRNRKIFFVNGWLGAFIGGQRSEEALTIVNKFLADNPNLDNDLRLKILENVDVIERAVRIRERGRPRPQ